MVSFSLSGGKEVFVRCPPWKRPATADGDRSADEKRWGISRAELEKRILRLYKGGTRIVKIGKTLGVGTGTVQRVTTEQPRPFDADVAEAYALQMTQNWAVAKIFPRD